MTSVFDEKDRKMVSRVTGDPGIDQPWYGIGFLPAWKRAFRKYVVFHGRASRGEYWWFVLANILVSVVLGALSLTGLRQTGVFPETGRFQYGIGGIGILFESLAGLYSVVAIIPMIAVAVRRLHDTGRSGGWWFI